MEHTASSCTSDAVDTFDVTDTSETRNTSNTSDTSDRAIRGIDTRRRRLLQASGAGLLAGAGFATGLGNLAGSKAIAQEAISLTFAFGPDDSGSLASLIDAFNAEHEGRIEVTWQEMPRASDAYHRRLESDFSVGATDIDIFGADIVWTAQFASRGWVRDLSGPFREDYSADDFLVAPLRSARYRDRLWGVPWFTDAGMLFYRRDLLEASGIEGPPATWSELADMAAQVRESNDIEQGFVFQGDAYEGGVTNALEYIWSAGGRVLTGNVSVPGAFGMAVIDPNVIAIDSRNSAAGLDTAAGLVSDGTAPQSVVDFREVEAQQAFLDGQAVFMRNWPYAYGLLGESGGALSADQVGVAPLPMRDGQSRSYSCLGGWNLMIAANSVKQEAAWTFIRFATAAPQQRRRAEQGGFLPTLAAPYEDEELIRSAPMLELGAEAIANARVRPVSPYYASLSRRIGIAWNRVLRGDMDGTEAVARLQREMERILRGSR